MQVDDHLQHIKDHGEELLKLTLQHCADGSSQDKGQDFEISYNY
jgi:hypothetical protein